MDDYIPISAINDFLFCPHSLYYHAIYSGFDKNIYHDAPQVEGELRHKNIEAGAYSTRKTCLQGLSVYSDRYRLVGKIDTFFVDTGDLVERKTKVKKIYDGYRYQLFGQYFALLEMGYVVKKLFIHSLTDNKRYSIALPNKEETRAFEQVLRSIRSFNIAKAECTCSKNKHENNIYRELY